MVGKVRKPPDIREASQPAITVKPNAEEVDRSARRADNVDLAIAKRLRAAREARGLTQPEFAALLEISYQQLQKYERGINRISGSVLFRSAQILGVDASELFPAPQVAGPREGASGRSPKASSEDPEGDARSELADFAEICDRILKLESPRLRRALLAVVEQSVAED